MSETALLILSLGCLHTGMAGSQETGSLAKVMARNAELGFKGSVYVEQDGSVLLDAAYGEAGGLPLDTSSRFWIASAGKQFVSTGILKLVDQGKIALDGSIADYLPAVPRDKRPITVRHLLAHASGLPQSYAGEGAATQEVALERLLALPLEMQPGEGFTYSNANYQLAAAIIERVSGKTYDDFLRAELLGPLGLDATGRAGWPEARQVVASSGPLPERLQRHEWGEQGIYSTTHNLARWYEAVVDGKVLSKNSVEALFSPVVSISVGHSALGWFLTQTDSGHPVRFVRGNEDFGANALVYTYPEDGLIIVVLTHAGDRSDGTSWSRAVLADMEATLF